MHKVFKITTIDNSIISFYYANNYFDKSIMMRFTYYNKITFQQINTIINYRTIFSIYSTLSALLEFTHQKNYIAIEERIYINDDEYFTFIRLNGCSDFSIIYNNGQKKILMQFEEGSLQDFIDGFDKLIISSEEWINND